MCSHSTRSMSVRIREFLPIWARPWTYLQRLVAERTRAGVIAGPFRGVKYVDRAVGSVLCAKLLGTYEKELHGLVQWAVDAGFDLIVNAGAAEGYYAVGFALKSVRSRVIAYELTEEGQALLRLMVAHNGVEDRVVVRGECRPELLDEDLASIGGRRLVVCDVEGYEDVLLDPSRVPRLRDAYILVEMHDFLVPGLTARVTERFTGTHTIEEIPFARRAAADFPIRTLYTRIIPGSYKLGYMGEGRPANMTWLWMRPKST